MRAIWIGAAVAATACAALALVLITRPPAGPSWAYPETGSSAPEPAGGEGPKHLAGSTASFSEAALHDQFRTVDWRPETRPPSPLIVREGHQPGAKACGFCHLPEGTGRPENASLAGLPADYIVRQLMDMREGTRRSADAAWAPGGLMAAIPGSLTPTEMEAAAQYFASRPFHTHTRVVETDTAPRATAADEAYRFATDGARQRLGERILEGPDDFERFDLRDDQLGYVAYVPRGAVVRGAALAAGGKAPACASCHGAGLKGQAGPPLAGRSPTGLFRQLYAFKTGARNGSAAAPMRTVTANLTVGDMIDLAAYAASLP